MERLRVYPLKEIQPEEGSRVFEVRARCPSLSKGKMMKRCPWVRVCDVNRTSFAVYAKDGAEAGELAEIARLAGKDFPLCRAGNRFAVVRRNRVVRSAEVVSNSQEAIGDIQEVVNTPKSVDAGSDWRTAVKLSLYRH